MANQQKTPQTDNAMYSYIKWHQQKTPQMDNAMNSYIKWQINERRHKWTMQCIVI